LAVESPLAPPRAMPDAHARHAWALAALEVLRRARVPYGDVRVVVIRERRLGYRNGRANLARENLHWAVSVRAWARGLWAHVAHPLTDEAAAQRAAQQAVAHLRALRAWVGGDPRASLGPAVTARGAYRTPVRYDPFTRSWDAWHEPLQRVTEVLTREAGLHAWRGLLWARSEERLFFNTEGAEQRQTLTWMGGGLTIQATDGQRVQQRSYPAAPTRGVWAGGWEVVATWDWAAAARRLADEARSLLTARPCPDTVTTVILDVDQMASQIHETLGHALELDRALGMDLTRAGSTYLPLPLPSNGFALGSRALNLEVDATTPRAAGSFAWDDEGVPAQRVTLIRAGRVVAGLVDRALAAHWGLPRTASARAADGTAFPLVRMTNLHLRPGPEGTLDDLIASTREGLLLQTNRAWSIDARRRAFRFGVEMAWLIRRGRRVQLMRDCTYHGDSLHFWTNLDAVAGPTAWRVWGTARCAKGKPRQQVFVGHGVAPARVRAVHVQPGRG